MNSPRAWVIFGFSVLMYLIAVTQRSTFGIAGVEATERFDVNAAMLSTFAVVQIATYAALQIPVGLLADRFGSRPLLTVGAAAMALGQAALAFSEVLWTGLPARMLVGAGDAFTFISVVRLLPEWFSGRVLAQLTQWLGMLGSVGQIVAAFPFAYLLHSLGWQWAFLIAASASVVAVAIGVVIIRRGVPVHHDGSGSSTLGRLRASISGPGTQLGFWSHMLGGTAPGVVGIMWGYPLLTTGFGYDMATASTVMSMIVVGSFLPGPIIGWAVASYPFRRGDIVLGMAMLVYGTWAVVLLWPTIPPVWLAMLLFFIIGAGGPSSLIGMDYARTFNPTHSVGAASGFVNTGGFMGALVSMFMIGLVLDIADSARVAAGGVSDLYAVDSFRIAFAISFVIPIAAFIGVLVTRQWLRRVRFRDEGIEAVPLWLSLWKTIRRPSRATR